MYLPRLYNPHPFICQTLYYIGFRVKKIEDDDGEIEWIIIKPSWWNKMSTEYELAKSEYLNSRDYIGEYGRLPSGRSGTV